MKRKIKPVDIAVTLFFIVIMLVGIAVVMYPIFSSWWNDRVQTKIIEQYEKSVATLDTAEKERMFNEAYAYNAELNKLPNPMKDYKELSGYSDILDVTGTGIMGYIDIPKINVHLPIYHGTSAEVLNIAVGHMEGTSLPVGGIDTHSVISAHSGHPSAKLFSSIDQLTEDDRFTISVLDEVYTYEVEGSSVVLPYNTDKLQVVPGQDLVTLLTCTPYGINTHRLLVRAHRIETEAAAEETAEHKVRVPADAVLIASISSMPFIILPLIFILMVYWALRGKPKIKRYISEYTSEKDVGSAIEDKDSKKE